MNIDEAFEILEMPKTASDDDLKSKYKKLAVQYHPDKFKEDPDKFKKINEAYQLIQDYKANPEKFEQQHSPFRRTSNPFQGNPFVNFGDIFANLNQQHVASRSHAKQYSPEPIHIYMDISFKDSVLGVDRKIEYKKNIKCETCDGAGTETVPNGCQSCNGFGRVISNNQNMIYTTTCSKCYGRNIKFKECAICIKKGIIQNDVNITLHIPSGTLNDSILRLRGAGNYVGANPIGDMYADVHVHVRVEPDPDLGLDGPNVVSHVKLSLLEALTGCTKEIKTIYDIRRVHVPAKSKNKDEIRLHGCGIKSLNGAQRVIMDVEYPEDIEVLINILKNQSS